MAETGQSWETIRSEWDIPRLQAWRRHLTDSPPIQAMVQAYLGIKSRKAAESEANNDPAMLAGLGDSGIQERPLKKPIPEGLCSWRKTTSV